MNKNIYNFNEKNTNIQNTTIVSKRHFPVGNLIKTILAFIVILGLLSNILAIARGSENRFTFEYFLSTLQNAPTLPWSLTSLPNLTITGNWGVFDFLRSFLNTLSTAWSVALYMVSCMQNLILFLLHFLRAYFLF